MMDEMLNYQSFFFAIHIWWRIFDSNIFIQLFALATLTPPPLQVTPEQMHSLRNSLVVIREREERGLVEAAMKFEKNLMRQKQIIKIKKLQAKMRRLTRELERETKIFEKMV